MPPSPRPPLLDQVLQAVARRYRLPAMQDVAGSAGSPAAALAVTIEHARNALEHAQAPDAALQQRFIDALAQLIREAMHREHGDPAYQAAVLTRSAPAVQEYATLQTHRERDHRMVRAGANAIAHPARRPPCAAGPGHEALTRLHTQALAGDWQGLAGTARQLQALAPAGEGSPLQRDLARLLEGAPLARLLRAAALESDPQVQVFQALRDRQGPRPGTADAAAYGDTAQRRGAAMEALATEALEALARRLDAAQGEPGAYRVVTSMRVPSSIPGSAERAKSEWDAVLLRRAAHPGGSAEPTWDLCLLLEAKASVDAATTDFARLQRGIRLLASADSGATYSFSTRQGDVLLRGGPLNALAMPDDAGLEGLVLYCTDAPAPPVPHLLGTASRTQLLGASRSMAFATALAQGGEVNAHGLQGVWQQLLQSPEWTPVLQQYPTLQRVRGLMVHVDDLCAAIPP